VFGSAVTRITSQKCSRHYASARFALEALHRLLMARHIFWQEPPYTCKMSPDNSAFFWCGLYMEPGAKNGY
jgi:hypothetical protein